MKPKLRRSRLKALFNQPLPLSATILSLTSPSTPSQGSFFCSWNLQIYSLHLLFLPTELFILHLFTCLPPFHHSGLSSNVTTSKRLPWPPIVNSHLPTLTLYHITLFWLHSIGHFLILSWLIYLFAYCPALPFYTAGPLFLIHLCFWHSPIIIC